MADLFGRRRIFLVGVILFTGASLLGGFAQNQETLIIARALQGVGAAVLSPATLTILTVTFTEQRARAKALGVWSAVAAGGGAAGALFGGILTDLLSWRWILFVNVPIGIVAFLLARFHLKESRAEGERQRLDIAGSLTVTIGLIVLVYGIVSTDRHAWGSAQTIITLAVAAAFLLAFVVIEARLATHPLMPLRLFKSRAVSGANIAIFLLGAAMFAMWFFLTLYLQQVLGYSACSRPGGSIGSRSSAPAERTGPAPSGAASCAPWAWAWPSPPSPRPPPARCPGKRRAWPPG